MSLPATDSFTTDAPDKILTDYSANWTKLFAGSSDFTVVAASDVLRGAHLAVTKAYWNADTFGNDQYSQFKVAQVWGTVRWFGLMVRASTAGANTQYRYDVCTNIGSKCYLGKTIDGVDTDLESASQSGSVNDVYRLEVSGTTLTCKKNGSTTGTPSLKTDDSLPSGQAGLTAYDTDDGYIDDWEGGNLGNPPTVIVASIPVTVVVTDDCI